MLDVKGCALQGLMHTAVLTSPCSSGFDLLLQVAAGCHRGWRPSNCSALARTSESVSLSSTSVSNSMHSASVSSPSVFRSMSCCNRAFALGGKRRALTVSTHSTGAATVIPIANPPGKAAYASRTHRRFTTIILIGSRDDQIPVSPATVCQPSLLSNVSQTPGMNAGRVQSLPRAAVCCATTGL